MVRKLYTTQIGVKGGKVDCHGKCDKYEQHICRGRSYNNFRYCRHCRVAIPIEEAVYNRCPCCRHKTRTKSRQKNVTDRATRYRDSLRVPIKHHSVEADILANKEKLMILLKTKTPQKIAL